LAAEFPARRRCIRGGGKDKVRKLAQKEICAVPKKNTQSRIGGTTSGGEKSVFSGFDAKKLFAAARAGKGGEKEGPWSAAQAP